MRVGGEIVPEMLEVDAFAAVHQRQRRLAVKMEMPEIAHQPNIAPVPDARQERVHQRDAVDLARILRRIGVGDHQPDVVPDNPDALEAQLLHERVDVLRHLRLGVAAAGVDDSPAPRKSGAITVCVLASSGISGRHMWLVSA